MILTTFQKFRLPKILDERGNLSVFENNGYFPFDIQWVSWFFSDTDTTYDTRLEVQDQVMIVLSGSLKLVIKEGLLDEEVLLDDSCNGIHLPATVAARLSWSSAETCAFIAGNITAQPDHQPLNIFPYRKAAHSHYELLGQ